MDIFSRLLKPHITVLIAALAMAACHSGPLNPLTQANLDRIQPDMSASQVEVILGQPTSSRTETIPIVGGTKTTYVYDNKQDHVVIVFKNDKMQAKTGNFSNQ